MATIITIISSNEWYYLLLSILGFYFLITYTKEFQASNLVDSFLYLINKTIILLLTISFLLAFIFELIGEQEKVLTFLLANFKVLIYYTILNFSLFYGFKFADWLQNFYKDNDLLNIKYFEKLEKENNKK